MNEPEDANRALRERERTHRGQPDPRQSADERAPLPQRRARHEAEEANEALRNDALRNDTPLGGPSVVDQQGPAATGHETLPHRKDRHD